MKHSGPTAVDDMPRQIVSGYGNFPPDQKKLGFCLCPLFLQSLGLFQMKCKNLGPLSNSPLLLFSPGKWLLMLSLVRVWAVTRNVTVVPHVPDTSACATTQPSKCLDKALCNQTYVFFCTDLWWLALLEEDVSEYLLDGCHAVCHSHQLVKHNIKVRFHSSCVKS